MIDLLSKKNKANQNKYYTTNNEINAKQNNKYDIYWMWLTFQDEEKDKNKNNKSKKQDIIHFHVQEYYIHTQL